MKINAKDLCSIKDIQELKSVDSINNILKVINSEITPMSVTAQTYEELFSVIAVLKKQWNNFNSDVYFKNENVKMIYSLLYARPEVRNINIGYEHSEYHNSDYPQNEKGYEQFEKNIKNKVYVLELWDSKCTPLTQSIVKRFKNRSSLHPLNWLPINYYRLLH